jgi:uncharacterized protein (TIGR02145 family)
MKKNLISISLSVIASIMLTAWVAGNKNLPIGTVYKEVKIGNQVFLAENLKEGKFRNGDTIPEVKTESAWKSAGENKQPAWCYYGFDSKNGAIYGRLYNWYAVSDPRGLAPKGWHVPTDAEWTKMVNFLGAKSGKQLKSATGWSENGNGTNSSGFSALPGGYCNFDGSCYGIDLFGFWWSSTEYDALSARYCSLIYASDDLISKEGKKTFGKSVRCVKD